ncbi:MAG: DUF4390 domain-containing protein [Gammaproteobacteria bacterium]|nr:DUF4390 domain-containing protein [Gammaproteobacteria bacterium]
MRADKISMTHRHNNLAQAALLSLIILLISLMPSRVAWGDNAKGEFVVRSASTELVDKVYRLNARIDYQLSERMLDALHKGIPLTVAMDIEVLRKRDYVWDEKIAAIEQRYQLSYRALTRQYLVKNLNTGVQNSFPALHAALDILGTVVNFPMLDGQLIDPDETYTAQLRARLDIEELPVPMRVLAYVYPGWRLKSEWYSWSLRP